MSEHYFSPQPGSPATPAVFEATVWGNRLQMRSAAGVFSHARLDLGTGVLVRSAQPRASARTVLDLGCGTGVLATALGLALPTAQVWAVDVNERARELTVGNLRAHGLAERAHVHDPVEVPGSVRFDEIWSNPPIRIGKRAVHDLLLQWLPRLGAGGRAVLVIGRNLGADSYQRWLGEQDWACDRLASAKGFRVLEVRAAAAR
ncbi:methyltransferase [soil metagenome]